jgi:sec-independent protein translocase protein TatC
MEDQRQNDDPVEASRMTLGEHLDELRVRLMRSVIALGIVITAAYIFYEPIVVVVLRPYHQAVGNLQEDWAQIQLKHWQADEGAPRTDYFVTDDPADMRPLQVLRTDPRADSASAGIFFILKCCLYFALAVAGPYIIWQMWQFVAAGLYPAERRAVYRTFPFAAGLFTLGVLFGYFFMVPYAYYALPAMTLEQVQFDGEISSYFLFLRSLSLGLGVVFLLPVLMLMLARTGVVDPTKFGSYRGHFLVGALIFSAVLTPPDPMTQIMMAVPMAVLFEAGRLLSLAAGKREGVVEPEPEPEAEAS